MSIAPTTPTPTATAPPDNSAPALYDVVPSPIGDLLLRGDGTALTGLHMIGSWTNDDASGSACVADVLGTAGVQGNRRAVRQASDRALAAAQAQAQHEPGAFTEARAQLAAYFAGELTEFQLPLAPRGTPFQLAVWQALRAIPYGTTSTYGEVAAAIGRPPSASRAVGTANGSNPIAVIVPCHRVIGADGSLVGFGGGLERKRTLLQLEGSILV